MAEVIFVAGLGYGDEGKGSIIDFLTEHSGSKTVVRYNGGPQAAHHVIRYGHTHCFSQFGSGSFVNGSITYLSKYMLIDPFSLVVEEETLRQKGIADGFERLCINEDCLVITPMHKLVGQMRELSTRCGSCGMGVGEAVRDSQSLNGRSLRVADLQDTPTLETKLDFLWRVKLDQAEQLADENPNNQEIQSRYAQIRDGDLVQWVLQFYRSFSNRLHIIPDYDFSGRVIFEGAQGVLLDVDYGFVPYVTKTKTTFANLSGLIGDGQKVTRIGVLRAYSTRHGAGPFVSEDMNLTQAIPDLHNGMHEWQGRFRIGWLDVLASRYALEVIGGVTGIALTNFDRLQGITSIKVCTAYEYVGYDNIDRFFDYELINGRKIIHRIKVQKKPDAREQKRLTARLFDCKPVYTEFKGDESDYLSFFESEQGLATPVVILSKGPKSKDKYLLRDI